MDNANYGSKFVPYVVGERVLRSDPFVLLDVGCGMGIDPLWRVFEPDLAGHGFDAQIDEIERLNRAEANPNVTYHASLVGLPADHPFQSRERFVGGRAQYYEPIMRSSGFAAAAREIDRGRESLSELNSWREHPLTEAKTAVSDFAREHGLGSVDFVKIDTDGNDLEVLMSAEDAIRETGILGFMVETPFNAAPEEHANSFPTIDLFLRERGFLLYSMSVNRYSRAALPAPFIYRVLAQTTFGQVMWGDLIYLRDGGSPQYRDVWSEDLSTTKLLKLACLYELFELPDCAAELLLAHEQRLSGVVDVPRALDLLTPPLKGQQVSYQEYRSTFDRDPYSFYPEDANIAAAATRVVVEKVEAMQPRLAGPLARLRSRRHSGAH